MTKRSSVLRIPFFATFLLVLASGCLAEKASAQSNPPAGMPAQYAAAFGVLTWVNPEYSGGVGQWSFNNETGVFVSLIPNANSDLDDQGNAYYALLDFQDSSDSQHNAHYFAYNNGDGTLSLRLKPGSAGTAPFAELNGGLVRDIASVNVGGMQFYGYDGGGYGGGNAYWSFSSAGPQPYYFHQVWASANGGYSGPLLADSGGHLIFGSLNHWNIYVSDSYGSAQYLLLNSDGSVRTGEVISGSAIVYVGANLSSVNIPSIVSTSLSSTSFYAADGTVLTWSEGQSQWSGGYFDSNNWSIGTMIFLQMGGGSTGKMIVFHFDYNVSENNWNSSYDISRASDGTLTMNGSGNGFGAFRNGATLAPYAISPAPPIQTFKYGGELYQLIQSSPTASGQMFATYQNADSSNTAELYWNFDNNSVNYFNINTSGQYLWYTVDSNGNYVLDSNSTGNNSLTEINGIAYRPNGNTSAPTPSATQLMGDLDVRGNVFTLGAWFGDVNQAALTLAYQDGNNPDSPASATWVGSRPYTQWLWSRAVGSGPETVPMMKLGADHVLTLYKSDGSAAGISMNPDTGRIRIAPQGDLSMGTFVSEPTP